MTSRVSSFEDHGCRVYWGHCGCDLFRGHEGPHVGLHFTEDDQVDTNQVHVMPQDYPHLFGEDAPDDDQG